MRTLLVGSGCVIVVAIASGQEGGAAAPSPSVDPARAWKTAVAWLGGTDPIELDFTVSMAGPRTDYDPVAKKPVDVPWRESEVACGRFSIRKGGVAFVEVRTVVPEAKDASSKPREPHADAAVLYQRGDGIAIAANAKEWHLLNRSDFGTEMIHEPGSSGIRSVSRKLEGVLGAGRAGWASAMVSKYGVCIQDPREVMREAKPELLPTDVKIDPHQTDAPGGVSCRIPAVKARSWITASLDDGSFPQEAGEHTDGFMTFWLDSGGHIESIRVIVQDFIHGGDRASDVPRTKAQLADPEVAKFEMFETVIWLRHPRTPTELTLPDEVTRLFTQDVAPKK